jgi:uncharacterized cupin superfamily protein
MTRIGSHASAPVTSRTNYDGEIHPEKFAGMREWRLAKPLCLTQFGVNQVTLQPGAWSSLRHWHEKEDEFVYVLDGILTMVDDAGPHELKAGDFAAFPANEANAHHMQNRSDRPATYLAVGSRRKGEETIHYPDEDFGPVHT